MLIVPVIDLMAGRVVRGVAGRRSEYRPIVSRIVAGTDPAEIARLFAGHGLSTIYLADLDAIGGASPDWITYGRVLGTGAELLVDAGVASASAAERLAAFAADGRTLAGIVVGLETVPSPEALAEIAEAVGPERVAFSLDLRGGELLTTGDGWRGYGPLSCAEAAVSAGVARVIVLDLASVGVDRGVSTLALCRELRRRHGGLEIISGGGVRGPEDLVLMSNAGCNAALVASALHDGKVPLDHSIKAVRADRGG